MRCPTYSTWTSMWRPFQGSSEMCSLVDSEGMATCTGPGSWHPVGAVIGKTNRIANRVGARACHKLESLNIFIQSHTDEGLSPPAALVRNAHHVPPPSIASSDISVQWQPRNRCSGPICQGRAPYPVAADTLSGLGQRGLADEDATQEHVGSRLRNGKLVAAEPIQIAPRAHQSLSPPSMLRDGLDRGPIHRVITKV